MIYWHEDLLVTTFLKVSCAQEAKPDLVRCTDVNTVSPKSNAAEKNVRQSEKSANGFVRAFRENSGNFIYLKQLKQE